MTIFVTGTISALFSIGKNVTRKRRAGINPRDGNFETSSNSPRSPPGRKIITELYHRAMIDEISGTAEIRFTRGDDA